VTAPAPARFKTKAEFLRVYRELLQAEPEYHWARDSTRLERFMTSVRVTIETQASTWNLDSAVARRAWKAIGGTSPLTYKKLRSLPV